jgi:hypothetical protein
MHVHAFCNYLPIRVGGILSKGKKMFETTVDYWTCVELAEALEQTIRNDLWSTAQRIAETASRITNKPEELVAALQQYEIKKAALEAASELDETSVKAMNPNATGLSRAG